MFAYPTGPGLRSTPAIDHVGSGRTQSLAARCIVDQVTQNSAGLGDIGLGPQRARIRPGLGPSLNQVKRDEGRSLGRQEVGRP